MNPIAIILWLWKYGHFRNPKFIDALNVAKFELGLLTLKDRVVKQAVQSIQELDAYLDQLIPVMHNNPKRKLQADGEVGPATIELMQTPRCSLPDYGNRAQPQGEGSWQFDCWGTGRHEVHIHIDESNTPSWVDEQETFEISREVYRQIGIWHVRVSDGEPADIFKSWQSRKTWWGLAEFNNGTCTDEVFNYRNRDIQGTQHTRQILDLHELGHNHNLQHTRGGIMNPTILSVPADWRDDVSYPTLQRFFGGSPVVIEPEPEPEPEPDEPTGDYVTSAEFVDAITKLSDDFVEFVDASRVGIETLNERLDNEISEERIRELIRSELATGDYRGKDGEVTQASLKATTDMIYAAMRIQKHETKRTGGLFSSKFETRHTE